LYRDNLRILIFVTLPVYSLLLAWAGWASWLLVGEYRSEFVFLLHVSTIGWALNTFAAPAYFMHLGKGDVGWNTLSHVVMGVMNVALGLMLGRWFGAHGVAWAYVIALATGSWLLIGLFQARNRIGWTGWAAREHLWLAAVCAVVSVAGWLDPVRTAASEPARFAVWLVGPPLALGLAAWFHPMRKELWHRLDLREARL
ncbi:MAG: hypothetical protein Q8P61_07930, partial [Candidatus Nanopelagicales bacterium]|nr:hypothetical protein [Candidatus Nanopelagicales bacterium]